jgi:hypothetical protein
MNFKIWIIFGLLSVLLIYFKNQRFVETLFRSPSAEAKSEGSIKQLSVSKDLGIHRWSASMGDISGDGVVLNCAEYPEGTITNVYILPGGVLATQSITWPITKDLLGTQEYESKAQVGYEQISSIDPALSEIRETVENCLVKNAHSYLYSCVWEIYVIRSQIRQLKRRQQEDLLFTYGLTQKQELSNRDFNFDAVYNRFRLEQSVYYEVGKSRLDKMLGRISDDCFQRLMSIHVFSDPLDLSNL